MSGIEMLAPEGNQPGAGGTPGAGVSPGAIEAVKGIIEKLKQTMDPEKIVQLIMAMVGAQGLNVTEEQARQLVGQGAPESNMQPQTGQMPPTGLNTQELTNV